MRTLKSCLCAAAWWLAALEVVAGPGALDPTFVPSGLNGSVNTVALQANGQPVIGGNFTVTTAGNSTRNHIARLYANGSLDTSFQSGMAGASGTVNCVAVQSDGRIVMGGNFVAVNNISRYGVARLNSNGALDGSFVPTNNFFVNALVVQTNNAVIIAGGIQTGSVIRLNADGSFDSTFTNYASGAIDAIAIQPDGKVIIGGSFTTVGGAAKNYLARLNTDGSLDTSFLNGLAGPSSTVRTLLIQPDGKILIGGDFTAVNGTSRGHVARLTSTGALDTGFNSTPGASGSVYALALQPDSSVLVAGNFTFYNSGYDGYEYYNDYDLARVYPDGTADTNFDSNFNALIYALAVQGDGGIIAGGLFTTVSGQSQSDLARVYGDLYPPQFILQPTNKSVAVGTNVTFTALVNNPTTTYFQWRKNGGDIVGATGVSYALYNVQLGDAGTYSVFASNADGGVTSSNAVLQVGLVPVITQQPVSLTVTQGQAAAFTVTASGTPLNYFWRKNGTFIPGATNASLVFPGAVFTDAATYICQVSNFLGNVASTGAVLTVYAPPGILVQPTNLTVGVSSNFTLAVTANGTTPLFYQWLKNGSPLAATNASLTVTNSQTTDSGGYAVVITNSLGSLTSSVATVGVIYFPPTITMQPVGGSFLVGSNFTLTVATAGSAPFDYQWNTNGSPISGANAATYSVNNAQTGDSGSYTVTVTNFGGGITSSMAVVNVGYAPVILQQPQPFTNGNGGSNTFSVTVSGSDVLMFQWFKDGLAIPNATGRQLILPSLQTNQVGYYSVAVTNLFGAAASSNAFLSISNVALPFSWIGLVAYYPFNGDASDASGNGNNGTNNGALLGNDRFGNASSAYVFNGMGSYIDFGAPPELALTNNFTLTAWCLFAGGSQNPTILSYGQQAGYELLTDGTGVSRSFDLHCNAQDSTPATYPQIAWYAVVAVVQNGTGSVYVNGALAAAGPVGTPGFAENFQIGTSAQTGGYFWSGVIDDVRIYNRPLASNEVAQLYAYEADLPVITSPPQSQAVMQGGTATFSVNATAANPLAYQWFKDGTTLSGATNAILVITNVQPGLAGNYTVAVSNVLVGVVSPPAMLTVIAPLANSAPSYAGNQFGFNISGTAGSNFVVEFSTNLQTWAPLATNTFGTTPFQFIDPGSAASPLRFYRTRY